jgi:S-ribosylhomocysteine lyase LuxS involved in autoinducer biosynthesis
MISKDDILDMCDLDRDEIEAIAEHEHIPDVAAAALGDYLIHQVHGAERVRDMIVDDIRTAIERQDRGHASSLYMALQHFLTEHPCA